MKINFHATLYEIIRESNFNFFIWKELLSIIRNEVNPEKFI